MLEEISKLNDTAQIAGVIGFFLSLIALVCGLTGFRPIVIEKHYHCSGQHLVEGDE
jgi:hypothetical protein